MRIESHSHAVQDRKKFPRFTFLPTAALTFGALLALAQNALAADEVTEATPAEEPFIRAEASAGAAFVKVAELSTKKASDASVRALSGKINVALTAALGKVEHYKIASYGTLHDWAGLLAGKKAASLLTGILNEEKGAKKSLKKLARSKSNPEAMAELAGAGR